MKDKTKLAVIDGDTLMDMRLVPTKFCVDTLLPQGICILGGAPKIGKSWLVLDLCVRIAKGEPIWNLQTHKGTVLYLCLEDTLRRVQERLNCIADEVPKEVYFATTAHTLAEGLCDDVCSFVKEHPDTVFVAIDTFQVIRSCTADTSYANDYDELRKLKALADELNITFLLVHHLRKQGDSDPLNKLSGTTGISGAVDAVFVLDKSKRSQDNATLVATGRDIEYRELEIRFSKDAHMWELVSDSLDDPRLLLPSEMDKLISFVQSINSFTGSNMKFTERYCSFSGEQISAKALKQQMNKWRYTLEEHGVYFLSHRSNGERILERLLVFSITKSISDTRSTAKQRLLLTRTSKSLSVPKANGFDSRTRMKLLLIGLLGISFERYEQENAEEQVWVISINITDSCAVQIAVLNYTSSEALPSSRKTTASFAAVTASIWVKSNVRLTA